jgi:transposase-like protein
MASSLVPKLENFEDGEPRMRDLDFAAALGYSRPIDIRNLIRRHVAQLEEFGVIFTVTITSSSLGGRPSTEYWLNERQALLLCRYAETPNADDVVIACVEAFYQFRHGALVPVADTRETAMLVLQKNEIVQWIEPQLHDLRVGLSEVKTDVGDVKDTLRSMDGKLDELVEHARCERRRISKRDCLTHIEFLQRHRDGVCPACLTERIVVNGLKTADLQFDHWYGRWRCALKETWPVCSECNRRFSYDTGYKSSRTHAFEEYQYGLEIYLGPTLPNFGPLRGGGLIRI